jgi:hypothetical protein
LVQYLSTSVITVVMNEAMVAVEPAEPPVERSCCPWPAAGCCGSWVVVGDGAAVAGAEVSGGGTTAL